MFHARSYLLSVTLAIGLLGATAAEARCPPHCPPVPKKIAVLDLAITSLAKPQAIEFTPVEVNYSFSLSVIGIVGPEPVPPPFLEVCPRLQAPATTTCHKYANPKPGVLYRGSVMAVAPPAGANVPLTIVVVKPPDSTAGEVYQNEEIAEASAPIVSSALYDLTIDGFEVGHTRSARDDTVKISLQGIIKSDPPHRSDQPEACSLARIDWCVLLAPQGDVQSGWHAVSNVRVGPFELVPEREDSLRFLFSVMNLGNNYWQQLGEGVANGFSTAGMLVLSAYSSQQGSESGGGLAKQLDDAMHKLHGAEFAECDGPLAVDLVVLTNKTVDNLADRTLNALTFPTGSYKGILPANSDMYHEKDNNTRCGSGGEYRVSFMVHRTSWRPWR